MPFEPSPNEPTPSESSPSEPLTIEPLACRLLEPADLEHCLALDQASLGGLWTRAQWTTELADPRRPGMGLWQREELVAMASGWQVVDELHITLVAVDPALRRQGLGRQVLTALLAHCRVLGSERATLEVAASNGAALALYQALGFREAGRRSAYYRNDDDALIQWLRLPPINDAERGCG